MLRSASFSNHIDTNASRKFNALYPCASARNFFHAEYAEGRRDAEEVVESFKQHDVSGICARHKSCKIKLPFTYAPLWN
jgi:hypothetical protein